MTKYPNATEVWPKDRGAVSIILDLAASSYELYRAEELAVANLELLHLPALGVIHLTLLVLSVIGGGN